MGLVCDSAKLLMRRKYLIPKISEVFSNLVGYM
jgi:hypothetical protein